MCNIIWIVWELILIVLGLLLLDLVEIKKKTLTNKIITTFRKLHILLTLKQINK